VLVKVANERGPHGMYVDLSRRSTDLARAHLGKQDLEAVLRVWENAADDVRQERQMLALAGEAFARRGKWQEAAELFRQLVQSQPVRNRNWTMLAPLLLQLGDVQVYREHCQAMVEAFGASKLPITLERTAKACLLMPDAPARLQAPIQMAAQAASLGADHSFVAYFCLADGIGRFRLGDYPEAATLLQRAKKLDGDRDPYLSITALCFLAMASQRQGEMEEALRFLAEADAAFAQRLPSLAAGDLGPAWPDWLICEISRREASRLLGETAAP
jgi:tetratricopeptide (TPR) repeat protein